MVMYNKRDIIRFISIKCDITLDKAKEILNAFYEFVQYNVRNGDMVSLSPLGTFYFSNSEGWDERLMNIVLPNGEIRNTVIPHQDPYTKLNFKVNKELRKYVRERTTNNQLNIIKRGEMYRDLLDDEDDDEDEECQEN